MSATGSPACGVTGHRAGTRPAMRWLRLVIPAVLAVDVYLTWAYIVGPFLADLIGLWPTRGVALAVIGLTLWRR